MMCLKVLLIREMVSKLYKNLILNGCSVIEFFNDKYDPFSFKKLSGWSEHMNVEELITMMMF